MPNPRAGHGVSDQVQRHRPTRYACLHARVDPRTIWIMTIASHGSTQRVALRELCGVRSGDKGDISDLTLFADDPETYEFLCEHLTTEMVRAHFGDFVQGTVTRYLAPNIWAVKFVMTSALGGGGPKSLRSDNLGKTLGAGLLRLQLDVPTELVERSKRAGRRPPA